MWFNLTNKEIVEKLFLLAAAFVGIYLLPIDTTIFMVIWFCLLMLHDKSVDARRQIDALKKEIAELKKDQQQWPNKAD